MVGGKIILFYFILLPGPAEGWNRSELNAFSSSRFQGLAFRCDKIVVIVTLLEAIEDIPDKQTFGGTKTSTIFTRDYFKSENLRTDI